MMLDAGQADAGAYWVEQLEAGHLFVERVLAHPVEDHGEPLVDIAVEALSAGVEVRCSDRTHTSGRPRLFLVRAGIVEPLLQAASELRALDHTLVIEDAFRTREMQRDLALADALLEPLIATLHHAEPTVDAQTMIRRLAVVVAARPKGAGHMAGAAVDVNVLGPNDEQLDVGGPYPTVSEKMPMASPFVSAEAAGNRRFIAELMLGHGFTPFPFEFWHYSRDDAFDRVAHDDPRPARYGPVDVLPDGQVDPAADWLKPLNEPADLARRLTRLLEAGLAR